MSPEQFARIEALFEEACALPADQRTAFVESRCPDDATVCRKVLRMLARDSQDAAFDAPALGSGFHVGHVDEIERRLRDEFAASGRYRLIEPLGEGGFGTVYRAEQLQPVRREVAIKVIKVGMDTRRVMARFEAERQTLARMSHPCIARVFDAGATPSGRPYFVMELVDGRPITQWSAASSAGLRERIELFLRVCEGVQHAHQKGVIHRDLKPSNILVGVEDGRPAPRIIDFGIARAVDRSGEGQPAVTEEGQPIGTLEYMSPEQAGGDGVDIDTRTDIYSLGVILYELITGTTPFSRDALRGVSAVELRRILTREDPPKPSTRLRTLATSAGLAPSTSPQPDARLAALARQLHGDLDWIVMKALEKDRARRYDSAAALADDIRRHFANEPVIARPPTAGYRFAKFARRHRLPLAIGGSVFALLIGAVIFTGVALVRISAAESEAQIERRIAETVNEFLNRDLLAAVAPEHAGIDVSVRDVLDMASQRIEGRFADAPRVEAALRGTIGRAYMSLGLYDDAQRHLDRAFELHVLERGRDSPDALIAQSELGDLRHARGRHEDAFDLLSDAYDRLVRTAGENAAITLRCAVRIASAESSLGRTREAAARLAEVARRAQEFLGPEHLDTLNATHVLASVYRNIDPAAAEALYRSTLAVLQRDRGPESAAALAVQNDLALLLESQGRLAEALALFEQVVEAKERIYGREHPETLDSANGLANLLQVLGRYDEAEAIFLRTLGGLRVLLGENHPKTITCMNSLGRVYLRQRRYTEAEPLCAEALARMRARFGELDERTSTGMGTLGQIYEMQERFDEAEPLFVRVTEIVKTLFGENSVESLVARNNLAQLYQRQGKLELAEPMQASVIATARSALPEGHWHLGAYLVSYGIILRKMERYAECEPVLLEAHAVLLAGLGPDHNRTRSAADQMAKLYEAWGRAEDAAGWWTKAGGKPEKAPG